MSKRSNRRPPAQSGPNLNRARQYQAVYGLDRCLARCRAADFTGSVTVFIPVKDGRFGEPSFDVKRFGEPP